MQQPYFLQAAGSANKQLESGIYLRFSDDNALLLGIKFGGTRTIRSTYQGKPINISYTNLDESAMSIQADAGTDIIITGGEIDYLACGKSLSYFYQVRRNVSKLDVSGCIGLETLDFPTTSAPIQLYANGCTSLKSINNIDSVANLISCRGCTSLIDLDLSSAVELQYADCSGCAMLGDNLVQSMASSEIRYFDISGCSVTTLYMDSAIYFKNLNTLKAANMPYLAEIQGLESSKIEVLDISNDVKLSFFETPNTLTTLNCAGCTALESMYISNSTSLTMLDCTGIPNIMEIRCTANNESVANSVANAISTALITDGGEVRVGANDTYVSIIQTAGDDKGWTVDTI